MRRQVDHHLARARAIGRRASAQARATVWDSLEAVERAVSRLYPAVTVDIDGDKTGRSADRAPGPRRNARQSGRECRQIWRRPGVRHGVARRRSRSRLRSRMTVRASPRPSARRSSTAARGSTPPASPAPASASPSSATSREIYGGTVTLGESEDLGGLVATLACRRRGERCFPIPAHAH